MRGVVSLAAALSIPLAVSEGHPFPYRNLILFIVFVVILVTLVFQGLTLPWVIRRVKPEDKYTAIPEEQQEQIIQKKLATVSLQFLESKYGEEREHNEHLRNLIDRLQSDLHSLDGEPNDANGDSLAEYEEVYLAVLDRRRRLLNEMNRSAEFDEDLIRKYLSLIDVEELEIREKNAQGANSL
jgi:CPA1 family monovalent cation:H+ antiporter